MIEISKEQWTEIWEEVDDFGEQEYKQWYGRYF